MGPNGPEGGDPSVVRTALACEARDGVLHVFFPPLFAVEDWLALTAAVEETADEIGRKVVLEGYLPPEDERLLHFSVTPDPGVIEVNIAPDLKLGPTDQSSPRTSTKKPAMSAWPRKSSTSTAVTSAPAAATTW